MPRYYCLVSTLNPAGTKWAYHYRAYDLHIPKGLVNKAYKNGRTDQTVSFHFASRNATHRSEADSLFGNGRIVRRARCKLLPSRKINMKVKKQLIKFGKKSWSYTNRNKNKKPSVTNSDDQVSPVQTSITAKCTRYWVYRLYDNGRLVFQQVLGCAEWSYSNGGSDGDDSDPSSPNDSGGIPVIGCSDSKPPDCAGVPGAAYLDNSLLLRLPGPLRSHGREVAPFPFGYSYVIINSLPYDLFYSLVFAVTCTLSQLLSTAYNS